MSPTKYKLTHSIYLTLKNQPLTKSIAINNLQLYLAIVLSKLCAVQEHKCEMMMMNIIELKKQNIL